MYIDGSLGFSSFWVYSWEEYGLLCPFSLFFTGNVPPGIEQTGHPTGVVFATDLSVLVPLVIIRGVKLWNHNPWGFVLTGIILVKTSTYGLALLLMSEFVRKATGEGDPMVAPWLFLTLGCMISFVTFFGQVKRSFP